MIFLQQNRPGAFKSFKPGLSTKKLVKESNYEILSKFIARLTGTLKDWWTTLGETDKMHFLTQQDFSVVLGVLHMVFLGDVTADKEAKRKGFFYMKCHSYNCKNLDKHFKRMIQLFYTFGAEVSLKQAFLSSLPEPLTNEQSFIFITNMDLS